MRIQNDIWLSQDVINIYDKIATNEAFPISNKLRFVNLYNFFKL